MDLDNLTFRTAQTFVNSYAHEDSVMAQHEQAMDCRDCETFLQLGIDAFHWVLRADQVMRRLMFEGQASLDHDKVEDAIRALCTLWLKSCEHAEKWVALQHSLQFKVDNLDEFRKCCEEMQAIVKAQESPDEEMPKAIAKLRDQAIEEHRNGQTAEFV